MIEQRAFRSAMGRFPTGVTVVATRDAAGNPRGLTVNSFTSVSLDPPLILVCIAHDSSCHPLLMRRRTFAVTVLSSGQAWLARRFSVEEAERRFDGVAWREAGATGDPVLADGASWFACAVESSVEAGDHTILVGRVEELGLSDREPLAFLAGGFGAVST